MAPPAGSHPLFGRDGERARAIEAVAAVADGRPRTLLIGGDAGIGKTSLVRSVSEDASAHGFTVLIGHCLDIEAAVPFAPVVEALRPLVQAVADDPGRPAARRLARLLDPATPQPAEPSSALDDLRQVLVEAATAGPVMLVLEDMHWAERSTRDFAVSAGGTAKDGLLLVLTFRSDDLTRRHPFRTVLAELARDINADRIDLAPLERPAITQMVTSCTGAPADPSLVGNVLSRSEGNPLYVEELLSGNTPTLSASLNDLLLTRVDALTPPARGLLRTASVSGTLIDTDLLAQVSDLDQEVLDASLREALDGNVIVRRGEDLAFRHGLLREAVYDDLLPGERSRTHARCGRALQARLDDAPAQPGTGTLGQLAYHHYAAHDLPAALAASVRAGLAAKLYGAREAAEHLERALDLWDQVPDPERTAGYAKADVVRLLAEVYGDQGNKDRLHLLIREAVSLLEPGGDRLLASRVYAALGSACLTWDDQEGHQEAVQRALEYAGDEPSAELARALEVTATDHARHARYVDGMVVAERAVAVARTADCPVEESLALVALSLCQVMAGQITAGLETKTRAIETAHRNGQRGVALTEQADHAWYLVMLGDVEGGLEMAVDGRERALAEGLPYAAWFCGEQIMEIARFRGQLDEADLMLSDLRDEGMPIQRWRWFRVWTLLARGRPDAALEVERETMTLMADAVGIADPEHVERQVAVFLSLGQVSEALRIALGYLGAIGSSDSPFEHSFTALLAHRAMSAAAGAGVPVPPGIPELAARELALGQAGLTEEWRHGYHGGNLMVAAALADQLAGTSSLAHWRAAAGIDEKYGDYYALRSRLGLAEALLAEGERDEGRELLVAVWQSARRMGATYALDQATRLATRTRVPLPEDGSAPGPLTRLTARELEVLDLLAAGTTNRTIAETLVISEKTVSVHVSHILAKLECANRGEAAALRRSVVGA